MTWPWKAWWLGQSEWENSTRHFNWSLEVFNSILSGSAHSLSTDLTLLRPLLCVQSPQTDLTVILSSFFLADNGVLFLNHIDHFRSGNTKRKIYKLEVTHFFLLDESPALCDSKRRTVMITASCKSCSIVPFFRHMENSSVPPSPPLTGLEACRIRCRSSYSTLWT